MAVIVTSTAVMDMNKGIMTWNSKEWNLGEYDLPSPNITELLNELIEIPQASDPRLQAVVNENREVFEDIGGVPEHYDIPEATIPTTGPPIKQKPYRQELHKRMEVERQVQDMLDKGIIRPSHSPWSSPITIVSKKDGTSRFCVDYRKVNAITIKDSYPIPRIQDILDGLGGATIFSTLDLRSGYWQIPIAEEDRTKTAFCCHTRLFEFNRMPFGLCNAPSIFQRTMNRVLAGLIGKICFVYIDDIVIFSRNPEEHAYHLHLVLDALRKAHLKVKASKCKIGVPSIELLGYIVSEYGVSPDPQKVAVIQAMPPPECKKGLQSFLGTINYYRQCIPDLAQTASPLYELTKNNVHYKWEKEHQIAFNRLKAHLSSDAIMAYPDVNKPYKLYTDASDFAIGAILTQEDQNGLERPIHFLSKALSTEQKKWATIEKEAFGVVYALQKLRPYLWGSTFEIFTDHKPLLSLFKQEVKNTKIQRWAVLISEFGAPISYIKGKKNIKADLFSRLKL